MLTHHFTYGICFSFTTTTVSVAALDVGLSTPSSLHHTYAADSLPPPRAKLGKMQRCGFEQLSLNEMLISELSNQDPSLPHNHSLGSGHAPSVTIVMTPVRTLLVVSYTHALEVVPKVTRCWEIHAFSFLCAVHSRS